MIAEWDISISGFRQRRFDVNGSDELWEKLRGFVRPDRSLIRCEWNDNMEALAAFISRMSTSKRAIIRVYAYSWGAGHGFIRLAQALWRLGMRIRMAVICDAVYKSRFRILSWLSLTPWPQIVIPGSVDEVVSFRQQLTLPRGHNLVKQADTSTIIHEPVVLPYPHIGIDRAPEFHDAALEVARRDYRPHFPALDEE